MQEIEFRISFIEKIINIKLKHFTINKLRYRITFFFKHFFCN